MISNPASWFINGHKKEEFTYEGGTTLYHFSVDNLPSFDRYMFMNVVFFANNEEHAAEVLERMLKTYIKGMRGRRSPHEEVQAWNESRTQRLKDILDQKHLWKFSLAPTNQFYEVGWASNDTFG